LSNSKIEVRAIGVVLRLPQKGKALSSNPEPLRQVDVLSQEFNTARPHLKKNKRKRLK
jgi:hypothetical protein